MELSENLIYDLAMFRETESTGSKEWDDEYNSLIKRIYNEAYNNGLINQSNYKFNGKKPAIAKLNNLPGWLK